MSDLIRDLKRASSKWLKDKDRRFSDFSWQAGYGAFSVSASNVDKVRDYIERQQEHHRKLSFKEELLSFLKKHGLDYDERHLWD